MSLSRIATGAVSVRGSLTFSCEVRACSWPCSFTSCRSALFYPLWVRSSGFFSSGSSICSCLPSLLTCAFELVLAPRRRCLRVRQSRPASAVHTPSSQCGALVCQGLAFFSCGPSWHSMSRSPSSWHSITLQRRFPTSCSPVHVLTHMFSSARFFTCCAWLRCGLVVPNTTRSPPLRALRVFRLVVNSARPCSAWFPAIVHSGPSSLPALCRRSSHVAALHESALSISVWGDRGSLPWSGFPRFGLRGRLPPKLCHCDSSQLSPLRADCVPRGHRALLDADMLELIDRSACLVEPVTVSHVLLPCLFCPRSKHVQRRVRSLLANSPSARPCGRSSAPWAARSELLLSLHCDSWI